MKTGLAHLRQDGFAFLTLKKPQIHPQPLYYFKVPKYRMAMRGTLKTIPIDSQGIAGRALHINVENYAPGFGSVKVQIADTETGEVIPGFSFEDCQAIDEASLDSIVTWNASPNLSVIAAQAICLEIELSGALDSPQIYSFWFADH